MVTPFNSQRLGQTANPFHTQPQAPQMAGDTPEQEEERRRQGLARRAQGVQGIASNQALSQVVSPAARVRQGVAAPFTPPATPPAVPVQRKPGVGPDPTRGVTGTTTGPQIPGAAPFTPPPTTPALPPEAAPVTTYNTNGYAQPGHVVAGSAQAPSGWDPTKWADTSHQTPKYAVGRILTQFPDTPEGLQAALPEIQRAYPGTELVGRDKLNIPGVGLIDVGVGFAEGGGRGWAWQDTAEESAGAQAFPGNASAAAFSNVLAPLGGLQTNQTDVQAVIANILAQLGAGVGGSGGG